MAKKVEKSKKVDKKSTNKSEIKKTSEKKTVTKPQKTTKTIKTKKIQNKIKNKKPVHHKVKSWQIISAVLIIITLFLIIAIGIRIHTGNVQFLPDKAKNSNFENEINNRLENLKTENEIYQLLVIEDKSCLDCEVDKNINLIKQNIIPELVIEKQDSENKDSKQLLDNLGLKILPAYFFSENIEKHTKFSSIKEQLIKIELQTINFYVIDPKILAKKTLSEIPEISENSIIFEKQNQNTQSKLTIFEVSDFSSPIPSILNSENEFTKELQNSDSTYFPPIPKIFEKYVETGKVKYVKINYPYAPIYKNSKLAHNAALCANEQNKYLLFENQLYTKRNEWVESQTPNQKFIEFGKLIQIEDLVKYSQCVENTQYSGQIENEVNQFLQYGVTQIPTFIIGNKILTKLNNYEKFEEIIEQELKTLN